MAPVLVGAAPARCPAPVALAWPTSRPGPQKAGFQSGASFVRLPSTSRRQEARPVLPPLRSAATDGASGAAAQETGVEQTTHTWEWRGHRMQYTVAGSGPPVLLIHGFGASARHFRANIPALAKEGYQVFALDLLGQGGSAKPVLDYSIELWAEQVTDFMQHHVQQPAVIVGNSIGSLVSLTATAAVPEKIAGVVLLNCAGGMNNKAISDDWRIKLAMPIFLLIDALLKQRSVAQVLFDRFRSPENIRQVLLNVYTNEASVDDELVDLIYQPSCDEGALDAFVSIITGPPGPRPDHLIPTLSQPLLVLWGDKDPFTPADGPVGKYFQQLPTQRENTQFKFVPTGHCPHDDQPELVHDELLPWLATVHSQ